MQDTPNSRMRQIEKGQNVPFSRPATGFDHQSLSSHMSQTNQTQASQATPPFSSDAKTISPPLPHQAKNSRKSHLTPVGPPPVNPFLRDTFNVVQWTYPEWRQDGEMS